MDENGGVKEEDVDMNDPLVLKLRKRKSKDGEMAAKKKHKKETIDVQVQASASLCPSSLPELQPRSYQMEVLEKALAQNTIVYLETGAGKTYIAVMLLERLSHRFSISDQKRIAVFLAPTVFLVIQQANVICSRTQLNVAVYHGDVTDAWDGSKWSAEVNSHQVLVMTPQIFYNALQLSGLTLDIVELIIFDECHHAQKNHPYASIMKTYYHKSSSKVKPRIFGMTGSLVTTKGTVDLKCSQELSNLESILDSKIYTLKNREELEAKAPTPYHQCKYYSKVHKDFDDLRARLLEVLYKYQQEQNIIASSCKFTDEVEAKKRISKVIAILYNGAEACLSELGLYCALLAVDVYSKERLKTEDKPEEDLLQTTYKDKFLKEIYDVLENATPKDLIGPSTNFATPDQVKLAIAEGYLTPKVSALIAVLMRYRNVEGFRCIVFVERIITARVLARLMSQFTFLDFVNTDYMIGVNAEACFKNSRTHVETLKLFREGKVNLLISTSVVEEGLDVQTCNSVVRFDLCHTMRSFIQSRGRARQAGAQYIWLLERGNSEHESLLMEMRRSEILVREEALARMENPVEMMKAPVVDEDLEIYDTESGIRISTSGSVGFIYNYCARLPRDRYYNPKPEFTITQCNTKDLLYTCLIKFPPNAPIHSLQGSPRRSQQLAKKVACLEAYKQLDAVGALAKERMTDSDFQEEKATSKDPVAPGSTKLKELFPSIKSTTLQGSWLISTSGTCLHFYALNFNEDDLMNFAFLVESRLDDDVGNIEVELFGTKNRMLNAKISSVKQCYFNSTQLAAAKAYQEIMFNGAFSRLVLRDNENDRVLARCLLTCEEKSKDLWNHMYLLLPMTEDGNIDWRIIKTTAEAAQILPRLCTITQRDTVEMKSAVCTDAFTPGVVNMANGPLNYSALEDAVVLTIHTGKLFCITGILDKLNASTSFQECEGAEICTYEEFYLRKHGRLIKYQKQPFLQAKPTHALHNHLIRPDSKKKKGVQPCVELNVELPPELCILLGSKSSIMRSLYLIPSVMYRFNSYIISGELRAKFTRHAPCAHASKILEALTSLRCQEGFCYEGLELLGDSVLKYAVSRKLFVVHKNKHEGQLSSLRSHAISNATLRKLAVEQGLTGYIRDEPFYPSLWLGAGMYRLRKRPCLCNLNNLVTETSNEKKKMSCEYDFFVGKTCGEGHRWMCSKTASDVLESLIGAYANGGGFYGALEFMKAMRMEVEFNEDLLTSLQQESVVPNEAVQRHEQMLTEIEKELSYTFRNKAHLLEAITHASFTDYGYCYQRLEFLGDAVLDWLITLHLYKAHPGLTPGLLSDLRSAAVNNDCFARVAVKNRLHTYLLHDSGELQMKVSKYIDELNEDSVKQGPLFGFDTLSAPKVLGDILESVAGAILVDTKFDLDRLWEVMKPLLSPLVTPVTLTFHPVREFIELCSLKGFEWKWIINKEEGGGVYVKIDDDLTFTEMSEKKKKKDLKKEAAERMLTVLKEHGHRHPRWDFIDEPEQNGACMQIEVKSTPISQNTPVNDMVTQENSNLNGQIVLAETLNNMLTQVANNMFFQVSTDANGDMVPKKTGNDMLNQVTPNVKPLILAKIEQIEETSTASPLSINSHSTGTRIVGNICLSSNMKDSTGKISFELNLDSSSGVVPKPITVKQEVIEHSIAVPSMPENQNKPPGKNPRMQLQELCDKRRWAKPTFEETEKEGQAHKRWFSISISMNIPGIGSIEQVSGLMTNKKRAKDDAAQKMLYQLKNLGVT